MVLLLFHCSKQESGEHSSLALFVNSTVLAHHCALMKPTASNQRRFRRTVLIGKPRGLLLAVFFAGLSLAAQTQSATNKCVADSIDSHPANCAPSRAHPLFGFINKKQDRKVVLFREMVGHLAVTAVIVAG